MQLSTTAGNIASAGIDGYSKRTTALTSGPTMSVGGHSAGSGVAIGETTRAVNDIQRKVYRESLSVQYEFDTRSTYSETVNDLLSDSNIGISDSINRFFTALQQVSTNPASSPTRQVLLNAGTALASKITTLDSKLADKVTDVNAQIQQVVKQINTYAANIAQLNNRISTSQNGVTPNGLLDDLNQIIDDLSQLVSVQTLTQADGSVNVFIGNGQSLVIGGNQMKLATITNPNDPTRLDVQCVTGAARTITNDMMGGIIGGLYSITDDIIEPTRTNIDLIAMTFAMSINVQHQLGIDSTGKLGENFFTEYNDYALQTQRVFRNSSNAGTAQFTVAINPITPKPTGPFTSYSDASDLVPVGTLSQLNASDLTIAGYNIRATVAGDDTISTVDNANSAIAIAAAINSSVRGVTATPTVNTLNLGTFTSGAFANNEFRINGVSIITTGASPAVLVQDINAQSPTTGVTAIANGNNITIFAAGGRNIQLTTDGAGTGNFQHFATNGGAALDQVQRAGVVLKDQNNTPITIAGLNPSHAGFVAGTTPPVTTNLTGSDYLLTYDGTNYTLTRQSDSAVVAKTTGTVLNCDGMTISLAGGTVVAGDQYLFRPTAGGAKNFALDPFMVNNPGKLAMASPISKIRQVAPSSTVDITMEVINTTGAITPGIPALPAGATLGNAFANPGSLTPPIQIQFDRLDPTIYRIFDITNINVPVQIGPDQKYTGKGQQVFPLAGVTNGTTHAYVWDPGYRVSISGSVAAGDTFTIQYDTTQTGNGVNARAMTSLQTAFLLSNQTASYQQSYNQLVSTVGSAANIDSNNFEAAQSLCRSESDTYLQQVGVNLDEEATSLIRFQQYYQAAAQLIKVGQETFNSFLAAIM